MKSRESEREWRKTRWKIKGVGKVCDSDDLRCFVAKPILPLFTHFLCGEKLSRNFVCGEKNDKYDVREWRKTRWKIKGVREVWDSDCREGFTPTGTREALVSLDFVHQLVYNKSSKTRSECVIWKISLMNESSYQESSYLKISCNATADISNQIIQHLFQNHLQTSPNWILYFLLLLLARLYIYCKAIHAIMTQLLNLI